MVVGKGNPALPGRHPKFDSQEYIVVLIHH